MTAEQQLQEISKELGYPADSKDVLFLVQRVNQKVKEKLTDKDKVIAKLEAELDKIRNQFHDLANQKLALEAKLNQTLQNKPKEETEEAVQQSEPIDPTPTEEEEVPSGKENK